jgi:hypothetical protein
MLAVRLDQLGVALQRLDQESHALLELSSRRGVADEEIATLIRLDPGEVARRREQVLEGLARELGLEGRDQLAELRATLPDLPAEHWRSAPPGAPPSPNGGGRQTAEADARDERPDDRREDDDSVGDEEPPSPGAGGPWQDAEPDREAEPAGEAELNSPRPDRVSPAPERDQPRIDLSLRRVLLGGLVVAAVGVGMAVVMTSSSDEGQAPPSSEQRSGGDGGTAPATRAGGPAPLRSPFAGPSIGTARLIGSGTGSRVQLNVSRLPETPEAYQVWLYNSVGDAISLRRFEGTRIELDARLPRDPARYRYIDISREPPDGNPNHSGASVLRVAIDRLR